MTDAIQEITELRDYIERHTLPTGQREFDKSHPPGPVTTQVDKIEGRDKK